MATRRGFLGALFGGAAATAGGLLIPKAVAAREKIEVTAPSDVMDAIKNARDGEITVCDASMIPDEFFETRVNLYQEWWRAASQQIWSMGDSRFGDFIAAHVEVNRRFGIVADDAPEIEKQFPGGPDGPEYYADNPYYH
jgi:hypothetical protein